MESAESIQEPVERSDPPQPSETTPPVEPEPIDPPQNPEPSPAQALQAVLEQNPLPVWMRSRLEHSGIRVEAVATELLADDVEDKKSSWFEMTVSYELHTERGETLPLEKARMDIHRDYHEEFSVPELPLFADRRLIAVVEGAEIVLYSYSADGFQERARLDYAPWMEEDQRLGILWLQELEDVGILLAVQRKGGEMPGAIIALLDSNFTPVARTAVRSYDSPPAGYLDEECGMLTVDSRDDTLIHIADGSEGYRAGTQMAMFYNSGYYIALEDGAPVSCQYARIIEDLMEDGGGENGLRLLELDAYEELLDWYPSLQVGERYQCAMQHMVGGNIKQAYLIKDIDTDYQIRDLGNTLYAQSYEFEVKKNAEVSFENGTAHLCYPLSRMYIDCDFSSGTMSLWTEYDTDFLAETRSLLMDQSPDRRWQVWRANFRPMVMGGFYSYYLYDSQTGMIDDFGVLMGDAYLAVGFMSNSELYVAKSMEENVDGFIHLSWQTLEVWNLAAGTVTDAGIPHGALPEDMKICCYGRDPLTGNHLIVASEHWNHPRTLYMISPGGELLLEQVSGIRFSVSKFDSCPGAVRRADGGYYFYCLFEENCWFWSEEEQDLADAGARKADYWEQVLEREISESQLTGASNLGELQHTLSYRLSRGDISSAQMREWLLRYYSDCREACNIRYDPQSDIYLEVSWNHSYQLTDNAGRPLAELGITRILDLDGYDRIAAGKSYPRVKSIPFVGNPDTIQLELLPAGDGSLLLCGYTDAQLFARKLDVETLAISEVSFVHSGQMQELRYTDNHATPTFDFDGSLSWQRQGDTLVLFLDGVRLYEMRWDYGRVRFE